MSTNDGGPAFPNHLLANDDTVDASQDFGCGGMSLRDYFAGQALTGLLAQHVTPKPGNGDESKTYATLPVYNGTYTTEGGHEDEIHDVAHQAYLIADAMLKARAQ